ncbi:MAG TPA: DUF4870 domain-containing protein [Marmoricola sp.]|nr:DUF4870 domain-containing protein [Marmoricola sp.]
MTDLPPPQEPYGGPRLPAEQERVWGSAAHWSALVASFVGGLSFIGPLVVLLVKGNESVWIRRQAVESLNFQLSLLIYAIISGILVLVLIGIVLLIAVFLAWLVLTIMASVKTANGEDFRYPLTIRMVS